MSAAGLSERLSLETLSRLPPGVERPGYDPASVTIGIVHFGPGAFHRAHQACFVDRMLAADPRWGISAVSLHSAGVRDALAPQDGLFAVAVLDETPAFRVVGSVRELLVAPEAPDAVLARLASPDVLVVTLTVTEKGYCLGPDGTLDLDHPDIAHDIRRIGPPKSVIGWLVEGLQARRDQGAGPLTVISCDNLADNGRKLRGAVVRLAAERDGALARWIEAECRFPRSMVDSITPATDDAVRARVAAALGFEDAWPVQREAFLQWVIEDDLPPGGPDWAGAGVDLTDDVAGWDRAKLRLLNGPHSTLAYLGLLRGHETVAEAVRDEALAVFVRRLMIEDIAPTLQAPKGLDLGAYGESVLRRFRNPAIRHLLSQIAWDGSQKLPVRLLGTVRDVLDAGRPIDRLALPIAAWMRFLRRRARGGEPPVDPMGEILMRTAESCADTAEADVALFLALDGVFGDLAARDGFRRALERGYGALVDMERDGGRGEFPV